ncbi:hypothetical protein [Reyranella massiliensis]|uniref:hypothetical protein n=1 Tax=Reyranella massiliensis TaxID=445220 RepID=UPI0002F09800|nr:hypothetical protein [Reyranella massiliensis]
MPLDLDITISADVDSGHVVELAAAIVDASDAWHDKTGKPKLAREISEALLCNVVDVLRGAPDGATRAVMAANAVNFIVRNCGVPPADVFAASLAMQAGIDPYPPMGSA